MSDEIYRRILSALNERYPAFMPGFNLISALSDIEKKTVIQEVSHLKELGLVDAMIHISSDGAFNTTLAKANITAKGRDYLKESGGLTAELNVVTVRLHADSIRDLINAQIEKSDLEAAAKSKLKEAVRNLPAHGLQEAVTWFVQQGLARSPDAIQWLQTLLPHAS